MTAYQGAAQLGGSTVEFDDVKLAAAGKPIVLNFWGGSCPPCRAEMPGFQRVYERNRDDFLMIGLDVGPFFGLGTRNSALSLLDELGITYPAAYATSLAPKTQVTGSFVAMSVFKLDLLPPLGNADEHAYYILHSTDDFIDMRFPEAARDRLAEHGAVTKLVTYEGGHGWPATCTG
ncbi:MAG: TlpA family protein disulfide reductase [Planctomycetes bacterium]|nr:TlpA family protein disulfide reductase [Planctomycetota bacterium]